MKKQLFIPNEISDIIDSLKVEFDINSISEAGTTSTLTVNTLRVFDNLSNVIYLSDGMIITINDKNYAVSNVDHGITDTFDIEETDLVATKWNVAANFQTGSRIEINQILKQATNTTENLIRFPLIWLISPEDKDFSGEVIDFSSSINMAFAYLANKTDRTQKRLDNTFDLIIQPLLNLFLAWVKSSDYNYMFEFHGDKEIDYSAMNFPFYGTSDKTKEVLNTTSDAIEVNLELEFKKQYEY